MCEPKVLCVVLFSLPCVVRLGICTVCVCSSAKCVRMYVRSRLNRLWVGVGGRLPVWVRTRPRIVQRHERVPGEEQRHLQRRAVAKQQRQGVSAVSLVHPEGGRLQLDEMHAMYACTRTFTAHTHTYTHRHKYACNAHTYTQRRTHTRTYISTMCTHTRTYMQCAHTDEYKHNYNMCIPAERFLQTHAHCAKKASMTPLFLHSVYYCVSACVCF